MLGAMVFIGELLTFRCLASMKGFGEGGSTLDSNQTINKIQDNDHANDDPDGICIDA